MRHFAIQKSKRIDMLNGSIFPKMLAFAIPLIATGMLQQSLNSVDVAVVGRFVGSQALAAVGSNGMIISLLINLFVGIAVGANVVIANYIGQNNSKGIKNAIATSGFLAVISGVLLLITGVSLARPILEWMGTPDDIIDLSTLYLRIYFMGMPFMMIYNFGAAILRSMGDTKRPFYILLVAGITNAALDLLFVRYFRMGVAGVSIATVIANGVSATIMVYLLIKEDAPYKLIPKEMRIVKSELNKILRIGFPAGLQGVIFSISNVFIQSTINEFGSDAVAGSAAALVFEMYCYFIVSAFAQATVAFTAQNYGASQLDRCKKVFYIGLFTSIIGCAIPNAVIAVFREWFISIFSDSAPVIEFASTRITLVLLYQFIACTYEVAGGAMRGFGYSLTPTIITLLGTCLLRIGWVSAFHSHIKSFNDIMWVYPVSWTITGTLALIAYFIVLHRVIRKEEPVT